MTRFWFLILGAMFASLQGHAWGPLGHVYIAEESTDRSDVETLFGAVIPDLGKMVFDNSPLSADIRWATHFHHDALPLDSPFAEGFWTHNQQWGGDAFAHFYFVPGTEDIVFGYVDTRAEQLADEFGLEPRQCVIYIHMAVDYSLRRDHGRQLGFDLLMAVLFADPALHEHIGEVFAPLIVEGGSALSQEEAHARLVQSAWLFRAFMAFYSSQMAADTDWLKTVLPIGAMLYSRVDYVTSVALFTRALELCEDYQAEFDRTIPITKAKLDEARSQTGDVKEIRVGGIQ